MPYGMRCAVAGSGRTVHERLTAKVSMMSLTLSGSRTTFVPSHRAFLVNSEHSSLMSTFCIHVSFTRTRHD